MTPAGETGLAKLTGIAYDVVRGTFAVDDGTGARVEVDPDGTPAPPRPGGPPVDDGSGLDGAYDPIPLAKETNQLAPS